MHDVPFHELVVLQFSNENLVKAENKMILGALVEFHPTRHLPAQS